MEETNSTPKLDDVDLDASQRAMAQNDPETAVAPSRNVVPPPNTLDDDGTLNEGTKQHHSLEGDFSERTHDQLPSVEAYKATNSNETGIKSRRFKFLMVGIFLFVLMIISMSIGIAIGKREGEAEARTPAASTGPHANMTGPPPNVKASRLKEVINFIDVTMKWSNPKDLANPNSPQHKAALWIADEDTHQYPIEDSVDFKNRYVLAVFFHAMKGPDWDHHLGWTSMHHTCEWKEEWPSVVGMPITVGVTCEPNTSNVTAIVLPTNNLNGQVPPEISLLTALREIDLYNNDVHGTISEHFKALTSLRTLVLHHNALTGSIPSWLSTLPKLRLLDLAVNELEGFIPHTLKELNELATLNVDKNALTGKLDPLKHMPALKNLIVSNNFFTGEVSDELFASWPALTILDGSNNHNLTGTLPATLLTHTTLEIVDLSGNHIYGRLPKVAKTGSKLVFLALHNNKLHSSLTSELGYLTSLHHLDASNNLFTGKLPDSLGELTRLKYLFLAYNAKLTKGAIPSAWGSLHNVMDLSLAGTERIGSIPTELGNMKSLVLLDLADNKLDDVLPTQLGGLHNLKFLILKNNELTGTIPSTFTSMPSLDTIVIDKNKLTGGASNICSRNQTTLRAFIADCTEIACNCCTGCCVDTNVTCNALSWFSQQDPVANYEYKRINYKFPSIIYPLPDSANASLFYETFGMPVVDRAPGDGDRYRL